MKQYVLILLTFFSLSSCATPKKEIISKSTIKLEGKNTGIGDSIEIGGYYACPNCDSIAGIMFFDDGIWVDFRFRKDVKEEDIKANLFKCVESGIGDGQVRWGSHWGIYQISNDTIIVSSFDYGILMGGYWAEMRYKIVDRENIQLVYAKSLLKKDENYNETHSPWLDPIYCYQFVSADSLPSSDCWIKEKKWTWRHESDWKDYMRKMEQKKK